ATKRRDNRRRILSFDGAVEVEGKEEHVSILRQIKLRPSGYCVHVVEIERIGDLVDWNRRNGGNRLTGKFTRYPNLVIIIKRRMPARWKIFLFPVPKADVVPAS